jgi:hypothetical protein
MEFSFITIISEMISNRVSIKSAIFSDYFISSFISTNSIEIEDKNCNTEILPLSVCDKISIDSEIL